MADWQTEQLNTVTLGDVEQYFTVAVPAAGRYVLEVIGSVPARVGLWDGASAVKGVNGLLGICGANVKGTHNGLTAGLKTISVVGLGVGSTQVRLRKFSFVDNWWSFPFLSFLNPYKSTCSIAGG